ncbi:MAG: hypothetical protein AAGG99_00635 [Pseudomonadota bacterium]
MKIMTLAAVAALAFGGLTGAAHAADLGGYGNERHANAPRLVDRLPLGIEPVRLGRRARCVAVGRTIRGRRIPGTRRVATGRIPRQACRRAFRQCSRALDRRQFRGRNPLGRCTIARVR